MGLIAHYRLDGDATDAVGDRDGQINGEVQWVKGALGGALDLTGGSKWVTGEGWPITGDFSYSFWAKQISATSLGGLVGNHWHTGGPTGVNVYFRSSLTQITIATADGTSRPAYHVNLITPITEWCHYAVTCRGGWVSVYQNGQHLDTRYRVIVQDQSRAWAIGRWTASYDSYYYEGLIDDVRIYDHALSPREVRDLSLGLVVHHAFQHDFYDAVRSERATPVGDVQLADIGGRRCAVINSSGKRLNIEPFSAPVATLTFWHKRDDAQSSSSYRTVLGCVANIHPAIFVQGTREFGLWDGSFKSSGYVPPNDGAFHFYTTVLRGDGTALFYVDGAYLTTVSTTLSLVNNPIDRIGSWNTYYAGLVGEVKLFATALTPAQVKEFYQQRASIDSEGNLHVS